MVATTLDMRYKTRELLDSIARGVQVIITYRGKRRACSPHTRKRRPWLAGLYAIIRSLPLRQGKPKAWKIR